jgi:hypothetical protein
MAFDQSTWKGLAAVQSNLPRPPGSALQLPEFRGEMATLLGLLGVRAESGASGAAEATQMRDYFVWLANWCNVIAGSAGGVAYDANA